jgi:hypothetical protein
MQSDDITELLKSLYERNEAYHDVKERVGLACWPDLSNLLCSVDSLVPSTPKQERSLSFPHFLRKAMAHHRLSVGHLCPHRSFHHSTNRRESALGGDNRAVHEGGCGRFKQVV